MYRGVRYGGKVCEDACRVYIHTNMHAALADYTA